jgi:hypothetical protein
LYFSNGLDRSNLHGQFREDLQVHPGRAPEFFRIAEDENLRAAAVGMDLPGDYESIPAVVAGAAEDCDFPVPDADLSRKDRGRGLPGIFHQNRFRYSQPLDGMAIHRPHLIHAAYFHHDPPDPDRSLKNDFALLCIPPAGGGKNLILGSTIITECASR